MEKVSIADDVESPSMFIVLLDKNILMAAFKFLKQEVSTKVKTNQSQTDSYVVPLGISIIIVSVLLTAMLSIFERNKNGRRPGVVIPIDFLKYDRLTYVYAAAFGCTSSEVVCLIFNRNALFQLNKIHRYIVPWVRVFVWLFMALLVAIKFYPVFALIRCKRVVVEPLVGFLYTGFIYAVFIYTIDIQLRNIPYPSLYLVYIPAGICYFMINAYFLYKLCQHIRGLFCKGEDSLDLQKRCATGHQYEYLKWLLRKRRNPKIKKGIHPTRLNRLDSPSLTFWIKKQLGLNSQLRGSPRVISTFVVSCIVLYEVGIQLVVLYSAFCNLAFIEVGSRVYNTSLGPFIKTLQIVCDVGFYTSITISSIFIALYMIIIYSNYRKDLQKMHRGDYSFLSIRMRKTLNSDLVGASLRYAGCQIAFLVWCYLLLIMVVFIVCVALAYMVILPLRGDVAFSFFEPVLVYLPFIIVTLIIRGFQTFLSRKFFLQELSVETMHNYPPRRSFALNNTRSFNVLTFLAFFFHAIIGLVTALNRVFIGLLIGLVAMARIDRCMLPLGFEKLDIDYHTYVGMILVELHHRNPVVAVFCDTLLSSKADSAGVSRMQRMLFLTMLLILAPYFFVESPNSKTLQPHSTSSIPSLSISIYAVALLLTILLAALEKNKKGGRFGIVIPIDFLKYDRLTFVYAAAFGCTADEVLYLVFNKNDIFKTMSIPTLAKPWLRLFVWLLMSLLVTLKFYPLFAVIRCKRTIVEPLIGFFYTGVIFAVHIYQIDVTLKENPYPSLVVSFVPSIICYAVIIVYYVYKVYQHIVRVIKTSPDEDHEDIQMRCASRHQYEYVRWLLKKKNVQDQFKTLSRLEYFIKWLKERIGLNSQLRGSPRVISTFVVASIALFRIGVEQLVLFPVFKDNIYILSSKFHNTTFEPHIQTFIHVIIVGYYTSFTISSIFIALYMIDIYSNYRKHLEKMHRGDYSFLHIKLKKTMNDHIVVASFRYAGFQIASLLWCYILCSLVVFILCGVVAYMVVLPLKGDVPFYFFEPVLTALFMLMIMLILIKGQRFLSRKYFLQECSVEKIHGNVTQRSLALDNTRCFNMLTFFAFFYHAIIGIVAALSRSLIGLTIGLISLARTDKCMLPVGFEKFDRGYSTYIGMILVELHHRNPVVAVFCDTLISKKYPKLTTQYTKGNTSNRNRRIQRRWQKVYTLLKNPSMGPKFDNPKIRQNVIGSKSYSSSLHEVHVSL